MSREDLNQLCADYFDGELDSSGRAALERELRSSAEARRAFWEAAEWRALLLDWGQQQSGREAAQAPKPQSVRVRSPRVRAISSRRTNPPVATTRSRRTPALLSMRLLASVLAVAAALGGIWWNQSRSLAPLAVLEQAAGARWIGRNLAIGAGLAADPLELSAGVAQLRFADGAQVTVQAPARLRLISPRRVELEAGRVFVEAKSGFEIDAPNLHLRDLGTRFGVAVAAEGTEAHVFDGRVEVSAPAAHVRLASHQAVAVRAGALAAVPVDRSAFPQPGRSIPVTIGDPDFEDPALLKKEWFPKSEGCWAGDAAVITGPHSGAAPHSGASMLRFTDPQGSTADLWQIVSLEPFRSAVASGGAVAELFAQFNCTGPHDAPVQKVKVHLTPFHGSASDGATAWKEQLATAKAPHVPLDADPSTWQTAAESVAIPPDADFLIISVHCDLGSLGSAPGRELFVDSVRLALHLPPQSALQR